MAHERRTPLSNIRGWLEAADNGVSDLQDLAVADAGSLRLSVEPVPVPAALEQVRAAHEVPSAQVGVALSVSAADVTIDADAVRLRQILDNLVADVVISVADTGSASPPRTCRTCSTGSGARTPPVPAAPAAVGWGRRSCGNWSRRTEAPSA